jgi:hypothetical protein
MIVKHNWIDASLPKGNILEVAWGSGFEYIDLDLVMQQPTIDEQRFSTLEVRTTGCRISYDPLFSWTARGFVLDYDNPGKFEDGSISDGEIGTAEYHFLDDKISCEWVGTSPPVRTNPACKLVNPKKQRGLEVIKRAIRDATFRRRILERDNFTCVLSGEKMTELLDAAHLVEVRHGGGDERANGLTLRKDLHALLDTRLLIINDKGKVELKNGVSDYYVKLLTDKELQNPLLAEVSASLVARGNTTLALK